MLRVLPPTSNLSCNKLVYCWLRKVVAESIDQFYLLQKNLYILRILPAQGKCAWQKVKKRPSIAWLPRNFNQSEVSIHATSKNLICCKTGFNVGGKTRNISFQLVAKQVTRSLGPRLSLSTKYMASTWMLLKDFHHTIIPVAVIKKRNFSLKTKSVFELSFTSLSPGAPNDNFRKNVCSEDDSRSRIFGTFVVKFLACLPLLGFSNI